jgi:transposase-like protein
MDHHKPGLIHKRWMMFKKSNPGVSAVDVATAIGVSKQVFHRWISEHTEVKATNFERIRTALKQDKEEFWQAVKDFYAS